MSRKQFLAVVALLALLVAGAAVLWQSEQSDWSPADSAVGQRVVPGLLASAVAEIRLVESGRSVTLRKSRDDWVVVERDGFPADVGRIGELLVKLVELKVVQTESVGDKDRPRLGLVEPADGAGDAGTRMELVDAQGKSIGKLLLGKMATRAASGGGSAEGPPVGRHLLVGDQTAVVTIVGDPLAAAEARADAWMSRDGFRVENLRSISVTGGDGAQRFALTRAEDAGSSGGTWRLADSAEAPDAGKVGDIVAALSSIRPLDVPAEAVSFHMPLVARAETADGPAYTLTIGNAVKTAAEEDAYQVRVEVAGDVVSAPRPAHADESADARARHDKAWEERRKALDERIAREKRLSGRVLLVARPGVDALLRDGAALLPDKP